MRSSMATQARLRASMDEGRPNVLRFSGGAVEIGKTLVPNLTFKKAPISLGAKRRPLQAPVGPEALHNRFEVPNVTTQAHCPRWR